MGHQCKVLIVEDEFITRQGIRNMVDWNAEGFEIVGEACNGREALELVEKEKPHIVLTDIVMPVMDGLRLEKELHARYPEIQMVVLSSYSDFEYVRDSFQSGVVDYVLKPTLSPESLLKTMKRVAVRIPGLELKGNRDLSLAACVEQMLSGFFRDDAKKCLLQSFSKPCFLLAGMDVARIYRQDKAAMERQERLLTQYTGEFLSQTAHVQLVVNQAVLLLVVNFLPSDRESVIGALHRAVEQIALQEPNTFYAVSRIFDNPALMKEVYDGPFFSLLDSYFYDKGRHLAAEEDFRGVKPKMEFHMSNYSKLLDTLQMEKALDFLEDYVRSALSQKAADEMDLKTLVQNSWYQLISVLEDRGLDADKLSYLKRDCLIKIYGCSYAEDFAEAFSVLQEDFRLIIRKHGVDARGDTMQDILNYIDGHYNEPLTLASLARQFNFNYSYLSSRFHAHHKEGFSEYLNRQRIRHAEELLKAGTFPVSDVCGAVGYTDQSYFTRVFKKLTGITPGEYRRRYVKTGR